MNVTHAITIRLPYAAAIRAAVKLIENRGRPIADKYIGQQVAIHAAATWSPQGARDERVRRWWWGPHRDPNAILDPTDLSTMFREIVAVATIAGCHQATGACCAPWGDPAYNDKPAWHIVLAGIIPIDGRIGPVRGSLAVPWELPVDVAEQVNHAANP